MLIDLRCEICYAAYLYFTTDPISIIISYIFCNIIMPYTFCHRDTFFAASVVVVVVVAVVEGGELLAPSTCGS